MLEKEFFDRIEKSIFFSEEQISQTLYNFYRTAAEILGYEEDEKTMYDCGRILVAANIQDVRPTYYPYNRTLAIALFENGESYEKGYCGSAGERWGWEKYREGGEDD